MSENQSSLESAFNAAIEHHRNGRLKEAAEQYRKVLEIDGNIAPALLNLSAIVLQAEDFEEGAELSRRAVALDPANPGALNNLGTALQKLGRYEEAISAFEKGLALSPNDPQLYNNKGNACVEGGDPEQALPCFEHALSLNPGYAEAHHNRGNALKDLNRMEEAAASFHQAVTLVPGFAEGHYNLAKSHFHLGQFEDAVKSAQRAIEIKPDYDEAWSELRLATMNLYMSRGLEGRGDGSHARGLGPQQQASPQFALLEHSLEAHRPHLAGGSYDTALASMSQNDLSVALSGHDDPSRKTEPLFRQTVALFHFGRSGTGLLHSLIDSHPQVSTLPSFYLNNFFGPNVWRDLITTGPLQELPERFTRLYDVLFDASSPKPVPGPSRDGEKHFGVQEGLTQTGDNRNEVLRVDRRLFCDKARELMSAHPKLDAGDFFQIIHAAYELALGRSEDRQTIFYHIHNPEEFAQFNFLYHFPDARMMVMVRDPVQSCESWIRSALKNNDLNDTIRKITAMLYTIDALPFHRQQSVGVRMEDLKSNPKETLQALCRWMGIEEQPTLYEMTAQGKKWWGDPSSPNYNKHQQMSPFGETDRTPADYGIFSDKDRQLLETLFYPFSVRFGYREDDPDNAKKRLSEARAHLDDLLDFEREALPHTGLTEEQYLERGAFQSFRSTLKARLSVLEEHGTYPTLLSPLQIDLG